MAAERNHTSDIYSYGILLSKVNEKVGCLELAVEKSTMKLPEKRVSIDTVIELVHNEILKM